MTAKEVVLGDMINGDQLPTISDFIANGCLKLEFAARLKKVIQEAAQPNPPTE